MRDRVVFISKDGSEYHTYRGTMEFHALTGEVHGEPMKKDYSDEDILKLIAEKDVPKGKPWRITRTASIPTDRTFRNAWTDDHPTETVDVDIERAKVIHLNKLRTLRAPLLDALDIEYQRADEVGDDAKKKEIAAKKKALRDVTLAPLPNDIDALKRFIPDVLRENT